jgi:carnitine-CoA ligase
MSRYSLADAGETFPQIVERALRERPDDWFVASIEEGRMSWAEIDRAGAEWSRRLAGLGVGAGDVVANLAEAGLQSFSWWFGMTRIGAIDAAINTEFRGRILAYAINTCGARVLLVQQAFLAQLEQVADQLESVQTVVVVDAAAPQRSVLKARVIALDDVEAGEPLLRMPCWHDIACITYTSGTTGPSKAVLLPWAQIHAINRGTFPYQDLGAQDVIYSLSPNAHFGSKSMPYLAAMIGGRIVMRKRFSGTAFWDDVAEFGVTTAAIVGPMAELLMRSPNGPGADTSLRNVFMAPLIPDYMRFNERFGTRICTVYNSTEGGVAIRSDWNPDNWRSCGRLREGWPGFEVRVVDEHDNELPDGTVGEAIIRSSVPWTMNAGYLNNPEATAKAWRNGWYHTGDGLMRQPDGGYVFVDRLKDAIRRRGENISSFEVEADVMANPDVLECAAVAAPGDGGEDEILLFVVPKPDSPLTPESLIRELMPRTARFMVPRYVEFIDALPRTDATRRVKKFELRQRGIGPQTWDRVAARLDLPR